MYYTEKFIVQKTIKTYQWFCPFFYPQKVILKITDDELIFIYRYKLFITVTHSFKLNDIEKIYIDKFFPMLRIIGKHDVLYHFDIFKEKYLLPFRRKKQEKSFSLNLIEYVAYDTTPFEPKPIDIVEIIKNHTKLKIKKYSNCDYISVNNFLISKYPEYIAIGESKNGKS